MNSDHYECGLAI